MLQFESESLGQERFSNAFCNVCNVSQLIRSICNICSLTLMKIIVSKHGTNQNLKCFLEIIAKDMTIQLVIRAQFTS